MRIRLHSGQAPDRKANGSADRQSNNSKPCKYWTKIRVRHTSKWPESSMAVFKVASMSASIADSTSISVQSSHRGRVDSRKSARKGRVRTDQITIASMSVCQRHREAGWKSLPTFCSLHLSTALTFLLFSSITLDKFALYLPHTSTRPDPAPYVLISRSSLLKIKTPRSRSKALCIFPAAAELEIGTLRWYLRSRRACCV